MLPSPAQDTLWNAAQQAAHLSADMDQARDLCGLGSLHHISGAVHSGFKERLPGSAAEAEGQPLTG